MYKILQLQNFKNFKCTGNNCPDHCCHSWHIIIDKKTFKKYKNSKSIDMSVIKKMDNPTDTNTAYMILDEEKNCPFLDEQKLCKIHSTLGAEHLCKTCKVYPRAMNFFNDTIEHFIDLSCPVAMDLLIESDKPLEFDIDLSKKQKKGICKNIIKTTKKLSSDTYFEIRALAISIIQNKSLKLKERLFILSQFSKFIDNSISQNISEDELKKYLEVLETDYIDFFKTDNIDNFHLTDEQQGILIENMSTQLSKILLHNESKNNEKFIELNKHINDTLLSLDKNKSMEFKNNILNKVLEDNEYIFENYIVYQLFTKVFPVLDDSCNLAFQKIITHLLMIEILMIGLYINQTEITKEDIRNAFYSYERKISHSSKNINHINTMIKELNTRSEFIISCIF